MMVKSHGYYTKTNMVMKQWRKIKMNEKLRTVLKKRYEADIEDAKYKIKCYSEHELVIPEHPDITAEVDKLLMKMAEAEDKLAVMSLHYGDNKTDKRVL
tara:strand:+ start:115 stop:411 length:297 start_codon:yes stop_codon:yes gene_type:complete